MLLGLFGAATSCTQPEDALLGTVGINLIGQAPSGAVYRLRRASITVTGGGITRIWNTEEAPDRTSLSEDVPVARYTATVAPGWDLERIDGSSATRVSAQLVSDNPVSFTVTVHQRTTVPLRFHVDSEDVDLEQGYDVVVDVEESPPLLIVVTNQNDEDEGSITVYPVGVSGDVAPLRTIAGQLTTLERPAGVTVVDHEIVVCDSARDAVSFFPLLADGNVPPLRQIVGRETGIERCSDVAVFDGEVYVAQDDDLVVFPVTANGNARPSRRIAGVSGGGYLAIDNGELYLTHPDAVDGGMFAFSLPVRADAAPIRAIPVRCANGIAAADGELFVINDCNEKINVYPAAANGDVPALRSFGGSSTVDVPGQMAWFRDRLYVTDSFRDQIWIFADTAKGDPPPFTAIHGPHTGLINPVGVAVH